MNPIATDDIDGADAVGFENNQLLERLQAYAAGQNAPVVAICAKMEADMSEMSDEDKTLFLQEMGHTEPGLNGLISAAFRLLGLQTYFTAGVKDGDVMNYLFLS